MGWKLFIDKNRLPPDERWHVARSTEDAAALIALYGYPEEISMESDLGENTLTGLEFLRQLTDKALLSWPYLNFPDIKLDCHSNNLEDRCRILGLWKSFQNKLARRKYAISPSANEMTRELPDSKSSDYQSLQKLVVAIPSRALFNLDESNTVFKEGGEDAYCRYQIAREDEPLDPGMAFNLVRKLLALNQHDPAHPKIEVILISRNSADAGLRIFNSIKYHCLDIERAAFTCGNSILPYISAFGAHLFLSAEPEDVREALEAGFAAATILPSSMPSNQGGSGQLRIAFDGDAALFSDKLERICKGSVEEVFQDNEVAAAWGALPGGPFRSFLDMLHQIQLDYPADTLPIRIALITAQGAPARVPIISILRAWNVRIDEALFLGGKDKSVFLEAFGADILFDNQKKHCELAG